MQHTPGIPTADDKEDSHGGTAADTRKPGRQKKLQGARVGAHWPDDARAWGITGDARCSAQPKAGKSPAESRVTRAGSSYPNATAAALGSNGNDSREQLAGKTAAELQPECSGGGYRTNDTGSHAGLRLGCNSTQPSTKPRRGKEKTGKDGEAKLRNSTPQTVSNARANYFASHTPNAKQHACSTQRGTQDTRACMAGSRAPRRHPTPTAPLPPPPPPHNPTHPHYRTHPPLPHHHLPRIH